MDQFPPALAHGSIDEVFPDVFFVSGAMEAHLQGVDWKFSRNMTVVREGDRLIIVNSVRLTEDGLAELDKIGRVTDVLRIGSLHGRDDPFYVDRYDANFWEMPGMQHETGLKATHTLTPGESCPIADASVFEFTTTKFPEGILHLEREDGIVIACDALQNWLKPDEFFSDTSRDMMQGMGFFTPANLGPVWVQVAVPEKDDFARLKQLSFKHALCGHGEPLRDTAQQDYGATFKRVFNV